MAYPEILEERGVNPSLHFYFLWDKLIYLISEKINDNFFNLEILHGEHRFDLSGGIMEKWIFLELFYLLLDKRNFIIRESQVCLAVAQALSKKDKCKQT